MLDQKSIHPGQQRYEKMIAGMYIGELVRYILLDLCKEEIIFTQAAIPILEKQGKLTHIILEIVLITLASCNGWIFNPNFSVFFK